MRLHKETREAAICPGKAARHTAPFAAGTGVQACMPLWEAGDEQG